MAGDRPVTFYYLQAWPRSCTRVYRKTLQLLARARDLKCQIRRHDDSATLAPAAACPRITPLVHLIVKNYEPFTSFC